MDTRETFRQYPRLGKAYGDSHRGDHVDFASGGRVPVEACDITCEGDALTRVVCHDFPHAPLDAGWRCTLTQLREGTFVSWQKPAHAHPAWKQHAAAYRSSATSWLGPLLYWPTGTPRIPYISAEQAASLPRGRGVLWLHGENKAVDFLPTRASPFALEAGRTALQLGVGVRRDTGEFCIFGGMLPEGGEIGPVGQAYVEFVEEAGKHFTVDQRDELQTCFRTHHTLGTFLSDDPRSTAEAWIATMPIHCHIPDHLAHDMPLEPRDGEDTVAAFWADWEDGEVLCTPEIHALYPHVAVGEALPLYASHAHYVELVCDSPLLPCTSTTPTVVSSSSFSMRTVWNVGIVAVLLLQVMMGAHSLPWLALKLMVAMFLFVAA